MQQFIDVWILGLGLATLTFATPRPGVTEMEYSSLKSGRYSSLIET